MMRVIKFGGTSVQDAQRIAMVLDIAGPAADSRDGAVLVSSAMAGVTNQLLHAAELGRKGHREEAEAAVAAIRTRHHDTAAELLGSAAAPLANLQGAVDAIIAQLTSLLQGILLLRECSDRTRDAIVGCGELLSTTLIAAAAQQRGIPAQWLDARQLIRTDESFGAAHVDFTASNEAIRTAIPPRSGVLTVTQGFIASTAGGASSTLGRGGSDYSAAIIAAALGADALEIWTDVDGIMTTDPRSVPAARRVPAMSYDEAAELAYFGAKVVHPSTIQPAVGAGVPIYVRNTHNPDSPGTSISNQKHALGLRAVAAKKNVTVITVQSSRMLHAYGFMQQLFAIFAANRVAVDLVATSEVSVSVSLDPAAVEGDLDAALQQLTELGDVSTENAMAIICLVGHDLWKDASFIARVFAALRQTPIRLISLGASDTNLSLVVPDSLRQSAVRLLHREFFPDV